jgi:hypothetical protein
MLNTIIYNLIYYQTKRPFHSLQLLIKLINRLCNRLTLLFKVYRNSLHNIFHLERTTSERTEH